MERKISLASALVLALVIAAAAFMSGWVITRNNYEKEYKEHFEEYNSDFFGKLGLIDSYYSKYYPADYDSSFAKELALRGLILGSGDRYGYYYTQEEFDTMMMNDNGDVCGIGVIVATKSIIDEEGIIIDTVFPSSPAEKAGIKEGDGIIAVEGVSVIGENYEIATSRIPGEIGSVRKLTMKRGETVFDVECTLSVIKVESVFSEYIEEEKIGFLRIQSFDETTSKGFKNAIDDLKEKGAEKFIFDLRGNGGGLLTAIIGVSESILPKDSLVLTARGTEGYKTEYKTEKSGEFDYPCAVLIDKHTASAAELFTAVMRDHKNAIIVGETSFGKGVMQSVIPLPDGSAFKLTTAYYDPPCGVNYDGIGIVPNVEAKLGDGERISHYSVDTEETVIKAAIEALNK